jgi:metal-responsive CopG/Arc/MetJ family transcriptional regulator
MATPDSDGADATKINVRLSEQLLADVDSTWQERGYSSRSEFIRSAIRDAVHGPRLSADTLESLLESERQRAEGETVSAEVIRERHHTQDDQTE